VNEKLKEIFKIKYKISDEIADWGYESTKLMKNPGASSWVSKISPLKSLPLWGNKSPTPPVTAASCGVLNQMLRNKIFHNGVYGTAMGKEQCPGRGKRTNP
jgi:hypothetical protein